MEEEFNHIFKEGCPEPTQAVIFEAANASLALIRWDKSGGEGKTRTERMKEQMSPFHLGRLIGGIWNFHQLLLF